MIDSRSIFIYFLSATIYFKTCYTDVCIHETPCFCQITEHTKINISKLLNDEKSSYLEDAVYRNGTTLSYQFSGCKNHEYHDPKGNNTDMASLLQINGTSYTKLGISEHIHFNWDPDDGYQIIYRTDSQLVATVSLVCDQYKQTFFKVIDEKSKDFVVSSPTVCIIKEEQGLSGGSIFLIILIVITTIYFLGGALVLYFIRGARGEEIIPNLEFWRNLPGLVKDGVIFLLSGCKPTLVSSAETYDRI